MKINKVDLRNKRFSRTPAEYSPLNEKFIRDLLTERGIDGGCIPDRARFLSDFERQFRQFLMLTSVLLSISEPVFQRDIGLSIRN
jgi:hypothetical protein